MLFRSIVHSALVAATLASAGLLAGSLAPAAAETRIIIDEGRGDYRHGPRPMIMRRDVCAPGLALRKAERMGLYRASIVRDNRRALVVEGRKRGRPVAVRFAQERGCPVIGVLR